MEDFTQQHYDYLTSKFTNPNTGAIWSKFDYNQSKSDPFLEETEWKHDSEWDKKESLRRKVIKQNIE
jgi:hypothetical protein